MSAISLVPLFSDAHYVHFSRYLHCRGGFRVRCVMRRRRDKRLAWADRIQSQRAAKVKSSLAAARVPRSAPHHITPSPAIGTSGVRPWRYLGTRANGDLGSSGGRGSLGRKKTSCTEAPPAPGRVDDDIYCYGGSGISYFCALRISRPEKGIFVTSEDWCCLRAKTP